MELPLYLLQKHVPILINKTWNQSSLLFMYQTIDLSLFLNNNTCNHLYFCIIKHETGWCFCIINMENVLV